MVYNTENGLLNLQPARTHYELYLQLEIAHNAGFQGIDGYEAIFQALSVNNSELFAMLASTREFMFVHDCREYINAANVLVTMQNMIGYYSGIEPDANAFFDVLAQNNGISIFKYIDMSRYGSTLLHSVLTCSITSIIMPMQQYGFSL